MRRTTSASSSNVSRRPIWPPQIRDDGVGFSRTPSSERIARRSHSVTPSPTPIEDPEGSRRDPSPRSLPSTSSRGLLSVLPRIAWEPACCGRASETPNYVLLTGGAPGPPTRHTGPEPRSRPSARRGQLRRRRSDPESVVGASAQTLVSRFCRRQGAIRRSQTTVSSLSLTRSR